MSSAGYSRTPLVQKLGVRAGSRIKTRNAPAHYQGLLEPLPDRVTISPRLRGPVSMWHIFSRARAELGRLLAQARREVEQDGAIWVSWPKRSSAVASDVTEDVIRELALPLGLVDVKVCAVDEVWSGLKLVIRKELRQPGS